MFPATGKRRAGRDHDGRGSGVQPEEPEGAEGPKRAGGVQEEALPS